MAEDPRRLREHQLEVMTSMTELLDSLATKEAKREVLAFLAASIGAEVKNPATGPRGGHYPRPKRRY